jgi:hypothetical protein
MRPLPEDKRDWIVLGFGGQFTTAGRFDGITCKHNFPEWGLVPSDLDGGPMFPNLLYAAPPNSAVVRANVDVPENARVLGWGGTFPERGFDGWAMNTAHRAGFGERMQWSGTAHSILYAIYEPSAPAPPIQPPQLVEEPTMAFAFPDPALATIPVPPGWIYLGKGNTFPNNRTFWSLYAGTHEGVWHEEHMMGNDSEAHYCARANDQVVRNLIGNLPSDAEVLGYGSDTLGPLWGLAMPTGSVFTHRTATNWVGAVQNVIYIKMPNPDLEAEPEPVAGVVMPVQQWNLMIGSDVIEVDKLRDFLITNTEEPSNAEQLFTDLNAAIRSSDPEVMIESWIEKEPSLIASIEFLPIQKDDGGVDVHAISESTATIADVITKAAAGVMLRGGFSNHFRYMEDGALVIDPSSPPTVDQAYELLKRTLEMKETASKLDNYSAWMLGMIADQFETYFGEHFDPSVVMAQTSRAYNTYICSLGTFRKWWTEKRPLSFTHHREVEYTKHLDHETGGKVLDLSVKYKLTVLQQRKLISYAKRFDINALEQDMAADGQEDVEDLMERIDIRAVNKRYLFFLRSTNRWYEYKGPFENIPNGASPIINADSRQIMGQDGSASKPDEWVPVGTIASPAVLVSAGLDEPDEEDISDEA